MQKTSVNKIILVGHIGNKPEGRYTSSGTSIVSFSLATNEYWTDNKNEKNVRTEWHNILAWGKLADFSSDYLYKGQLIYVEGKIQTRIYEDKDGISRKIVEVISNIITPLEWNSNKNEKDPNKIEYLKNNKEDEDKESNTN